MQKSYDLDKLFFFTLFQLIYKLFTCSESLASQTLFTLTQAIQYAIEHSLQVDNAQKIKSMREFEYQNAVSKLFPSLDLSITHGVQSAVLNNNSSALPSSQKTPGFGALHLGLTESLYDNGVSLIKIEVADKNKEIAALSQNKVKASLILDIVTEFYHFSLLSTLMQVREKQLETLKKQFELLSIQYQQGLKPRLDFLRFKTQVQRAEIEKTNTEKQKDLSEIALMRLLGVPSEKDWFQDRLKFKPIQIQNGVLEIASKRPLEIENFYDYKVSLIQKEINKKITLVSRRQYWPQLIGEASLTYSHENYFHYPYLQNQELHYQATLKIQYNFLDWGLRKRDVLISDLNRDIEDSRLNLNLIEVQSKMTSLHIDMSRVQANYVMAYELLKNEEENYSNVKIQYYEGKVTYLDLITSLSNLLDAKIQYYSVHFEGLQLLAKYQFYDGSIYETFSKTSF